MSSDLSPLAAGPGLVYRPARWSRIAVLLHGAGGNAGQAIDLLRDQADRNRLALVAPQSNGPTWDLLLGGFGPDLDLVERAVEEVAEGGPAPVAIGGFSDGASYALSVGLGAGDHVDALVAFSPGFAAPARLVGRPRVFVSHGTDDRVLPIDRCGRRVAATLSQGGYDVTYQEFVGGHEIPGEVRDAAAGWLTSPPSPPQGPEG